MAGINQDIRIGITASDMGEAVNGENSPFNVRMGLSYNLRRTNDSGILMDCDVEKPVDMTDTGYRQWLVNAGAEIRFFSRLFLRGGYKSGNSDEGFTVGGGFIWPSVCAIDYAFMPHDELGAAHRISLSFNFGDLVARPAVGAPPPPENVTATAGDRTASVSWDPAGQEDITGYNVYYREKGGEKYSKLNSDPITDERKLTMMLSNDITYQFVVTSVNSRALESVYSPFAGATPKKPESKKPLRVDGVNTSEKDGNIMVEWNDTRDEVVAGYNLYYKKRGDAKFRKLNQKLLSENRATLGGLQKKVRYFFMVTSVSVDGIESDYSEISSQELPVEGY